MKVVDLDLDLPGCLATLSFVPEYGVLFHYKFKPSTPDEIRYLASMNYYYRALSEYLSAEMLGTQSALIANLTPDSLEDIKIAARVSLSVLHLAKTLLSITGCEGDEKDQLSYALFLDFHLLSFVDNMWSSGLITGIQPNREAKTLLVQRIRTTLHLLEEDPTNKNALDTLESLYPEDNTPTPLVLRLASMQLHRNPSFKNNRAYRELLAAIRRKANFIRKTPNYGVFFARTPCLRPET
jgi:hypothetical protein